jgi:hypothetical protein
MISYLRSCVKEKEVSGSFPICRASLTAYLSIPKMKNVVVSKRSPWIRGKLNIL